MRGNSPFPNRGLALLGALSCCLSLPAQILKVDPHKTITFQAAGATAAYSLDASLAEASAEDGLVSISGKQPGTTHVVVIRPSEVQTFEVLVTTPPPHYPPGFVMPVSSQEAAQSGDYEVRYFSNPAQIQSELDLVKIHGDNRTNVHLVTTDLVGPLEQGQPRTALSSASYQIITQHRNITLLDQYVDESPLSLNGTILRGFHMRQNNWFTHVGYTTALAFQGLFLPTQPELVAGGGYRHSLTDNSSLTASYFHFQVPASDPIGHSGDVATISYKYSPRETLWFIAEAGISNGIASAARLYYQTSRDNLTALIRYEPTRFASLGTNNLRGFHADVSWARHLTNKLDLAVTFYDNNLALPNLKESTVSGAQNLRYQLTRHWSVSGGASASSFQTKLPLSPAIRNFTLPASLSFQSKHFGATGQYQFAVAPGRESDGNQFRASLHSGWGAFAFTGYAERDTNVPTLSFILGQVAGLQQELNLLGITATSVQQVDELLSTNSSLIAAGYIKGATINLAPVRVQIGSTADWSSRGAHHSQVSYSLLFNDNHSLQGSTQDLGHTLSYSKTITHADEVMLTSSVFALKCPGSPREYTPNFLLSWRHQFQRVPTYIVPERRGTIAGTIFRDDDSKGVWQPGMTPMSEVEVTLDDGRRTRTNANGSYRFSAVPRGRHRIAVIYHSQDPFFFTTPSDLEVDEVATVNFGIGHSLSGIVGRVLNDAGQGVAGVTIAIQRRELKWSVVTNADGSFLVPRLVAGDYDVQLDEDSLPIGYSAAAGAKPQVVIVGSSSPGKATFTLQTFRSISGRVLTYDENTGQYVPVLGARVNLMEPGAFSLTDNTGRYMFRNLPPGSYTVSVQDGPPTSTRKLRLGAQPVDLTDVDFPTRATHPAELTN